MLCTNSRHSRKKLFIDRAEFRLNHSCRRHRVSPACVWPEKNRTVFLFVCQMNGRTTEEQMIIVLAKSMPWAQSHMPNCLMECIENHLIARTFHFLRFSIHTHTHTHTAPALLFFAVQFRSPRPSREPRETRKRNAMISLQRKRFDHFQWLRFFAPTFSRPMGILLSVDKRIYTSPPLN